MRRHPSNIIDRGKEAVAVGVSAALFATLGGMAAKASAASEKGTIKSNVPHLVSSGLRPERSQLLPPPPPGPPEKLSPQEYKIAKQAFDHANNGPANENIIDNGGMRLMPGTIIYKAPMGGAVDHVIGKQNVEFWYFERLMKVRGELWAAARNIINKDGQIDEALDTDWATDPGYSLWVKVSQAESIPGYEHLMPWDSNPNDPNVKPMSGPPVYQIRPNDQDCIVIDQPHPEKLSDPRYLANFMSYPIKALHENGWEISANGIVFLPTKKPVRFVEAKPIPKLPANVAND